MLNFLSVDPSLRATGWAAITRHHDIDTCHHGTLTPRTLAAGRWHDLKGPQRLAWIAAHIRRLAQHHHARFVALEGYAFARPNQAHQLGELGGVIRTTLWGAHIPYLEVAPKTLKLWAAGTGNADKRAMIAAARDLLGYRGTSHDQADALLLHALVADAMGQAYHDPERAHQRAHEALPPVVAAISKIDILNTKEPA